MRLTWIFAVLAAIAPRIPGVVNGNRDSDRGSSTTTQSPFLVECRVPANSSLESINVNLTEDEREVVESEGRCYLACATSDNYINEIGMKNYSLSNYWPFIDDSETQCSTSGQVHECTRGCVRALKDNGLTRTCPDICADSCRPVCDPLLAYCHPWLHASCPITCHRLPVNHFLLSGHPCFAGCKLFSHLEGAESYRPRPVDPVGPPRLVPDRSTLRPGQFIIDLTGAAPQPREGESIDQSAIFNVTFLFRFEEMNSSNVSYNWTMNPFERFDLFDYSCRELLVSFAVSNKAGLSNFSRPTLIKVHGDERLIPDPPINAHFSEELDTRIGFFGHVILNIAWETSNDVYIDDFMVTVSPAAGVNTTLCGSESWARIVPHEKRTVDVVAESPLSLPVMTCRYDIQIHSVGPDGMSAPLTSTYTIPTTASAVILKVVRFDCQRLWQVPQYLFWFNLTWSLPPYLRHGNVIHSFTVVPMLKDGTDVLSVRIDNVTVPYTEVRLSNFTWTLKPEDHKMSTAYYLPQHIRSRDYYFKSYVIWNTSSVPYTPPSFSFTCTKSALSPAPSLVENFIINSYTINNTQITLDMDWSPPSEPNGELAPYNICIGGEPLEADEELVVISEGRTCTSQAEPANIIVTLNFVPQDTLYVQIRAHNLYVPGNWSDTYNIDLSSTESEQVTTLVLQEVKSTTSETPVGIIVGASLGCLVLAILVCCLRFVVWYIRKLQQRKKTWRTIAKNNPYVVEPSMSKMDATSVMPSNSDLNGHSTQQKSDGAIELSPVDEMKGKVKVQIGQSNGPEIKMGFLEDDGTR